MSVGLILCVLVVAIIAGLMSSSYKGNLPYPFDFIPIYALPVSYVEIATHEKYSTADAIVQFSTRHSVSLITLGENNVHKLFVGEVIGTESVDIMVENEHTMLFMLDKYGYVWHATHDTDSDTYVLGNSTIYIGPGRPLGFHLHEGILYVCDSVKGLLAVDILWPDDRFRGDRIRVLSNSFKDSSDSSGTRVPRPINYANDLDLGGGGKTVYFSSSTGRGVVAYDSEAKYFDTMRSFLLTWLAGDISGRVFAYDISSGTTSVIIDKLFYANGVAVSADDSYLLVVETMGLRVWKVFLSGPRQGEKEIFIEHLPAFPDGITRSRDGRSFLISLVAPLSPLLPWAQSPFSRWLFAWALMGPFKAIFSQAIKKCGCVVRVSADSARVSAVYLDKTGATVSTISAVTEDPHHAGRLFFGNLGGDYVSYYSP
jgi:hypothetical protein